MVDDSSDSCPKAAIMLPLLAILPIARKGIAGVEVAVVVVLLLLLPCMGINLTDILGDHRAVEE